MIRRLIGASAAASLLIASAALANSTKTVTFWISSPSQLDITNVKVATIGKPPIKVKLGKACAGKAGKFQIWQGLVIDMQRQRDAEQVDVVSNGIPANAEILGSLRVEGSCTEDGKTWTKYSGVLEVPKKVAPKPKPNPKPSPKPSRSK